MITFMRSIFLIASFASFFSATDATIKDCGAGLSVFQFTELSLKPDPPVSGEQLDMTVKFVNPGSDVAEGTVTTSLTLNFIPFSPITEPLCDSTKCPILNGFNDRSTSSTWPNNVHGKVSSRIEWLTNASDMLLCIQISATVASKDVNKTSLRGIKNTSAEQDLNAVYSAFRRMRNLNPVVNKTESSKNHTKRAKPLLLTHKFQSYADFYNTSSKVCLPEEAPSLLSIWGEKSNALVLKSF